MYEERVKVQHAAVFKTIKHFLYKAAVLGDKYKRQKYIKRTILKTHTRTHRLTTPHMTPECDT